MKTLSSLFAVMFVATLSGQNVIAQEKGNFATPKARAISRAILDDAICAKLANKKFLLKSKDGNWDGYIVFQTIEWGSGRITLDLSVEANSLSVLMAAEIYQPNSNSHHPTGTYSQVNMIRSKNSYRVAYPSELSAQNAMAEILSSHEIISADWYELNPDNMQYCISKFMNVFSK